MAAKIIPFPRFMQRPFTLHRGRHAADARKTREWDAADCIHLVGTAAPRTSEINVAASHESQQAAFRIVQEVQQEWNERHHAEGAQPAGLRPPRFWATLPLPLPQRETPLAVARRLMHMLLSHPKTA